MLDQIFDPQPTIDAAIRKITVTEQQRDADEGNLNPTTTTASTADGLFTQGWGRGGLRGGCGGRGGRGQRGRRGRGRLGRKEKEGTQYNCTHCNMDNHTTAERGRLKPRANEEAPPRTCFYCALPGRLWNECPTRKRAIEAHGLQGHNGLRKKQNTGTATAEIAIAGSDHGYEDRPLH